MNARTNPLVIWIGPALGIACMIALAVFGLVAGHPQLLVIASSVAAASASVGVALSASARRGGDRR